jgi:hypothetical protein
MTAYSREVSELGEFGEGANDNPVAPDPDEGEGEAREIGDARPAPRPEGEYTDPEPVTPPEGS